MTEDIKTGLSRRTLAKGAAWTVPAAAVVAAAPAYAKSGCTYELVIDQDRSCKKANDNDYRVAFDVTTSTNNPNCQKTADGCVVTITKIVANGGTGDILWQTGDRPPVEGVYLICDAGNMGAKLAVTATLSCDGGAPKVYEVKANQFTSNASDCGAGDFCGGTSQRLTNDAPADEPEDIKTDEPEVSEVAKTDEPEVVVEDDTQEAQPIEAEQAGTAEAESAEETN